MQEQLETSEVRNQLQQLQLDGMSKQLEDVQVRVTNSTTAAATCRAMTCTPARLRGLVADDQSVADAHG